MRKDGFLIAITVIILAELMIFTFLFLPWSDSISESNYTIGDLRIVGDSFEESRFALQYTEQNETFRVFFATPTEQNVTPDKITVNIYNIDGELSYKNDTNIIERFEGDDINVDVGYIGFDLESLSLQEDGLNRYQFYIDMEMHWDPPNGTPPNGTNVPDTIRGEANLTLSGEPSTMLIATSLFENYGLTFLFIGLLLVCAMIGGTFMSKIEEVDTRTGVEVLRIEEFKGTPFPDIMPEEEQVGAKEIAEAMEEIPCPECRKPLTYVKKDNKHLCRSCKKYQEMPDTLYKPIEAEDKEEEQ
jgi:hypothetical protein